MNFTPSIAEQQLQQVARERSAALIRRDVVTLKHMLSDDFIYTNASGMVLTKQGYLQAYVESSELVWQSQELDDVRVQVYGDAAVLTARVHDRATFSGQLMNVYYRTTQVYVRNNDEWKYVAGHTSNAGEPAE